MLEEAKKQKYDDVYMTKTKALASKLRNSCLKERHTAKCPLQKVVKSSGHRPFNLSLTGVSLSSTGAPQALVDSRGLNR